MNENPTGPDWFASVGGEITDAFAVHDMGERTAALLSGLINAQQANTAMLKVIADLIANATNQRSADLEGWDKVIPPAPLEECWGKNVRRPACADRHTEDCDYAEPPPEPKHVLLDVGTRVLFHDLVWNEETRKPERTNPKVGKIAGYDLFNSKYQINEERYGQPGEYYDFVTWAFADNRVEVHPDGPEYPPPPIPDGSFAVNSTWRMRRPNTGGAGEIVTVIRRTRGDKAELLIEFDRGPDMPKDYRRETWPATKFTEWYERYEVPTGPRVYVQGGSGVQGYIVDTKTDPDYGPRIKVHWLTPGGPEKWATPGSVGIITPEEVYRCPNGQDGEECSEGENQCELCLEAEDAEAEEIERKS
jgi:hypothetical protein